MTFPAGSFSDKESAERYVRESEGVIGAFLGQVVGTMNAGKWLHEIGVQGIGHSITEFEVQGSIVRPEPSIILARN